MAYHRWAAGTLSRGVECSGLWALMSKGLTAQGSLYCGCSGDKCPALQKRQGLWGLVGQTTLWTEGPEPEHVTPTLSPAGGLHRAWGTGHRAN